MTDVKTTANLLSRIYWLEKLPSIMATYVASCRYLRSIAHASAYFAIWEQYFGRPISFYAMQNWLFNPHAGGKRDSVQRPEAQGEHRAAGSSGQTGDYLLAGETGQAQNLHRTLPAAGGARAAPAGPVGSERPPDIKPPPQALGPKLGIAVRRHKAPPPEAGTKDGRQISAARFSHSTAPPSVAPTGEVLPVISVQRRHPPLATGALRRHHKQTDQAIEMEFPAPPRSAAPEMDHTPSQSSHPPHTLASHVSPIEQVAGRATALPAGSGKRLFSEWRDRNGFSPYLKSFNLLAKHFLTISSRAVGKHSLHQVQWSGPTSARHAQAAPPRKAQGAYERTATVASPDPMAWHEHKTRWNGQWIQHIHNTFHVSIAADNLSTYKADHRRLKQELRRILEQEAMQMGIDV